MYTCGFVKSKSFFVRTLHGIKKKKILNNSFANDYQVHVPSAVVYNSSSNRELVENKHNILNDCYSTL